MRNFYILLFFFFIIKDQLALAQAKKGASMESFITDLMKKMTIEEKIGQLNLVSVGFDVTGPILSKNVEENIQKGNVGGVFNTFTPIAVRKLQELAVKKSRLGIPLLFGYDVIHGHRTIFPIPLGLAAAWDMALIEKMAQLSAEEASADGLNWVFSPMVDIARDPRWGRIAEGSGEDTWYASEVAKAMVKGYQGTDLFANNTVLACVKHFALYGAGEAGRDYNTVDMSELRMFQDYFPPFKAALDAGAGSIMTSFNDINGIPASRNPWLLDEILRQKWNFNGLVVSDYTSLNELIPHGVAKDEYEVAAMTLKAGVDMDMVGEVYLNNVKKLIDDGKLSVADVDKACRRILEAKYKLGLFENPYRYTDQKRADQVFKNKEFREAARDIARKSFVLLKNQNEVLPLKSSGSIALIGPLAKNQRDMIGNWSGAGDWKQAISVEQGLKNAAGNNFLIHYAQGVNITNDTALIRRLNTHGGELMIDNRTPAAMIEEAVALARKSDIVVAVVGESQGMSGEAASRSELGLPGNQLDLLKALKATGKPLVVVLMNGRPLTLVWENENVDAILETWFAGSEAGNAIADVLLGKYNPSGKITATFPQNAGQIPLYYNHKSTGRPFGNDELDKYKSRYLDVTNEPLFPFGYGLSYTSFAYGDITLNSTKLGMNDELQVSIKVTNSGKYDGEEVIQLYIKDMVASVTPPVKELKNFRKIFLKAGESQQVTFTISEKDLRFYNTKLEYISEPGDFKVFIGTNSRDVKEAEFILVE